MSNETQTTQPMSPEDLAVQSKARAEGLAAAEANNAQQAIADAPRGEDDVPPIGPIPADDLLFSMNETQAVYLYFAHGLSGAHSHDEVIEQLQAKRDAAPVEPVAALTATNVLEAGAAMRASVAAIVENAIEEAFAPASEPTPERAKVWNINLQAWV